MITEEKMLFKRHEKPQTSVKVNLILSIGYMLCKGEQLKRSLPINRQNHKSMG